jgi:hypothetical protein
MRIAYLNPWKNAAENQAYFSLAAAARKLGHEVIDCRTATDVEGSSVDFVLSVASSIPKVVDVPSYLVVHEPGKRFLGNSFYLNNLLTYDGYLTVSDSLNRLVRDISVGAGRSANIGFYYNTPQISDTVSDIVSLVRGDELRIVYLGTNWDRRLPALFKALDSQGILRVHGPEASWKADNYVSYAGALPFDGVAPQRAYAESGMGLVLLSADHLREDVISNRIFEICSVGALAVCPDTPWIRKWFGDSVLYFDPAAAPSAISEQVLTHHRHCQENPGQARIMAGKARAIFERHFAAERMIENAVAYHAAAQNAKLELLSALGEAPAITVIVRCGGRPVEMVRQAVDSIRRQTFGRFRVIFSKYHQLDLSTISNVDAKIQSFTEILTEGGGRAATLNAGLSAIHTEFFAVLDDDDFWLSDHVESLFLAARMGDPNFDVAFAGSVCIDRQGTQIERALIWDRNIYAFGFRDTPRTVSDITGEFSSNCFIARSDTLGRVDRFNQHQPAGKTDDG